MSERQNMEEKKNGDAGLLPDQAQEDLVPKVEEENAAEYDAHMNNAANSPLPLGYRSVRELVAEVERLQKSQKELANEIGTLNDQLGAHRAVSLEDPAERRFSVTQSLTQLSSRLTETQERLTDTQKEHNETKNELNDTKTKLNKAEIALTEKLIEVENAQNAQNEVENLKKEKKKLEDDLKIEKSTNETEMKNMRATLAGKNGEITTLISKLHAANQTIENLRRRVEKPDAHKKCMEQAQARIDEVNRKAAEREAELRRRLEESEKRIQKQKEGLQNYEAKFNAVRKEADEFSAKIKACEKRQEADIDAKNEEIVKLTEELETTNEEWKEKMEAIKKDHQLENEGHLEKFKAGIAQISANYNAQFNEKLSDLEKGIKKASEQKEQQDAEEPSRKKRRSSRK
ncbi:unnamed protein product [Caenorhabditis brenneri]